MFADIMFGLKVTLIGMGVTFVGLITLIALIHLNRIIAESINKVPAKKHEDPAPVKKEEAKAAPKPVATPQANNNNVIAAITAAVSVMMEGTPFRLKSVKRAQSSQSANAWDIAAIQEQNNNF